MHILSFQQMLAIIITNIMKSRQCFILFMKNLQLLGILYACLCFNTVTLCPDTFFLGSMPPDSCLLSVPSLA